MDRRSAVKWTSWVAGFSNRLLKPAGLKVTRATSSVWDLRSRVTDPIEAVYLAEGRYFVIDVALPDCRAFNLAPFACTADSGHPFVETLLAYDRGESQSYQDSPLRAYYEGWQPASAAELLGLAPDQAHPALRDAPSLGATMPWSARDPETWMTQRARRIEQDNRQNGARLSHRHGALDFGPVSEAKGALEFDRLVRLYGSIRGNGYRRSRHADGDIAGVLLCRGSASRIWVRGGQHRIAALAALGWERAPIRLFPYVVHRADVASWPNVRSGLFTPQQALEVFDRIFDGRHPSGRNWRAAWGEAKARGRPPVEKAAGSGRGPDSRTS